MGKSSLINGLVGRKVVSVSRTPGHTRYFQTYFLTPSVKLCDCPGLIFPSLLPKQLQVQGQRKQGGLDAEMEEVAEHSISLRSWRESTPLPKSRSHTPLWATWPPGSLCRSCFTCATQRPRIPQPNIPGVPGTSVKVGCMCLDSSSPTHPHPVITPFLHSQLFFSSLFLLTSHAPSSLSLFPFSFCFSFLSCHNGVVGSLPLEISDSPKSLGRPLWKWGDGD